MKLMKLPRTSGEAIVKMLSKAGFEIVGRKGSHIRLKKVTKKAVFIVVVPNHSEITKGTLKSIIRQSGMNREEFIRQLKKV